MDDTISKRKSNVLLALNNTLKKFRDVSEQIKMDIRMEVKNMPRLGFYNGPLLAIGMVMYNTGIKVEDLKTKREILDSYATYLTINNAVGNNDGPKNDILRYLIIVTDYYNNIDVMNNMLDIYVEREEIQYDEFD
jgi:hypothetical protein